MTEKQLSRYYSLNKEIKDLEERIAKLGDGVGSTKYNDSTTNATGKIDPIQERIVELKDMWMEARVSALEEHIKIECYISNIDDSEIRLIMRRRFLDLKSWGEIGKEFHSDRTTVSKKVRKYIKEQLSHNSHQNLIK